MTTPESILLRCAYCGWESVLRFGEHFEEDKEAAHVHVRSHQVKEEQQ